MRGKIALSKTPGRKDKWVTQQVENDYFLSLHVTHIDETQIQTTQDAFNVLRDKFPKISANGEMLNDLFRKISLPPGADDILHITLGNFPDFRSDRNVANIVDKDKVLLAEELDTQEVRFELSVDDFELVATSENISQVKLSAGTKEKAFTVGYNRDAVLNLKPSAMIQKLLADFSKQVFGSDFVLWNAQKQSIPYHITIAQTNQLTDSLARLFPQPASDETISSTSHPQPSM